MDSGILEGENFASALRSISQRRRQGVIEIQREKDPVKILFVQGKIVEFLTGDRPPSAELAVMISNSGLVGAQASLPTASYRELLEALRTLPQGQGITPEVFKSMVRHRILDCLYRLNLQSGERFAFAVQMVEYERDFAPSISPGQVLLDMVALTTESDRFNATFPAGCLVKFVASDNSALSEEEWMISQIAAKGISLEDLRVKSMISAYHLQESLLDMADRGLVSVSSAAGPGKQTEDLFARNVLRTLNGAEAEEQHADNVIILPDETEEPAPADLVDESAAYVKPAAAIHQEEAEEGEAAEEVISIGFKQTLRIWSSAMLQRKWIPGLTAVLFAILALLAPLAFWQSLVLGFSR